MPPPRPTPSALAPLLAGVLLVACGDDVDVAPSAPAPGVDAATATPAGGQGGGSGEPAPTGGMTVGMGGAPPVPMGEEVTGTGACIEYVVAQLERKAECFGWERSSAFESSTDCPELFLLPGSTRTADNLLACAAEWRLFDCERVIREEVPDCVTPGTRAEGEPCEKPSQCASEHCYRESADVVCGRCAPRVAEAEACSAPEVECDWGLRCTSGVCARVTPIEPLGEREPRAAGEECQGVTRCPDDYSCSRDEMDVLRCLPLPVVGEPCLGLARLCVSGAFCEVDGTCHALPVRGEPCASVGDRLLCVDGLVCDETAPAGPVCRALVGLGEACEAWTWCLEGDCRCEDEACTARRCLNLLAPGDACPDPLGICHPGTRCEGGVCTPRVAEPNAECGG